MAVDQLSIVCLPRLQAALTMNGWLEKRGGQDATKVTLITYQKAYFGSQIMF